MIRGTIACKNDVTDPYQLTMAQLYFRLGLQMPDWSGCWIGCTVCLKQSKDKLRAILFK